MASATSHDCPDFMKPKAMQKRQSGNGRPEDSDVLLPRGGSWSSISSISTLSYMQEAAATDTDATSPKRASSLDGRKRHSHDSALGFFHQDPAAAASTSTPSVTSEATDSEAAAHHHHSALSRWLLGPLAGFLVSLYDVLMRFVMVSYYVVGLDAYATPDEYMHARALKQTRRYVEACRTRLEAAVDAGKVHIDVKPAFTPEDLAFATHVLRAKHGMPLPLVWAWRALAALLRSHPGARFTTATDCATGRVVGLFLECRQAAAMHHFITALVDHEASRQHGIYIAKYHDLISSCIRDRVPLLRLGPTTAELKVGLGAIPLPPMVVGSAVWARLEGRCSVVCFGVFTSVALFLYLTLTQWHLDASGAGALTLAELAVLYTCCMGCVKLLPLWSIGLKKIIANPRKYLVQTSFYAQGAVPGAVLGIALVSAWRQANPLLLMDGLSLFLLLGECIGRLGCHFYGCCFGRALFSNPQAFSRWSVVYLDQTSSVARLRPEYLLRPLLPTQVLQSLFALVTQAAMLGIVASCQHASGADGSSSYLRVGMVGVMALTIYSVGRLIFFTLREDENFKSNRSYTTAYMALATLAGCAAVQLYSYLAAPASTIALAGMPTLDAVPGFGSCLWSYLMVAAVAAGTNFVVQALHHHEKVGIFPDLAQLLAPITSTVAAQGPALAPATGARTRSSGAARQVWSSWQGDKDN